MCRVLDVATSGRSAYLKSPPSRREENRQLNGRIAHIHAESHETCGPPLGHAELQAQGTRVSMRQVARCGENSQA